MYLGTFSCISSLGNSAHMTFLAYEAGIMGGKTYEGFFCENGKAASLSLVPDGLLASLPLHTQLRLTFSPCLLRRVALLHLAIEGLLEQTEVPRSCALIWVDEETLSRRELFPIALLKEQCYEAGLDIADDQFMPLNMGRSSGLAALHYANEIIETGRAENVLIVSASSPLEPKWLEVLDAQCRLKNEGALDAFIPGEMGACLLVTKTANSEAIPIRLGSPNIQKSANHWFNEDNSPREQLAECWRHTLLNSQP